MLSTDISYTDVFTGNKITEKFYFHLTEAEILELDEQFKGGIAYTLSDVRHGRDQQKMSTFFKTFIGKAYGYRPVGTNDFIKSKELSDAFVASEAYSELLFKILEEPDFANNFFEKVCPNMDKLKNRIGGIMKKVAEENEAKDMNAISVVE